MLMYEAIHFHNNKLSPSNTRQQIRSRSNSCGNNNNKKRIGKNNRSNSINIGSLSSSSSSSSSSNNSSSSGSNNNSSRNTSANRYDNNNIKDLTKTRSLNQLTEKMYGINSFNNNNNNNNNNNHINLNRSGSFVVGQKLRESKWFQHEEVKILCAVIETGFIVELKITDDCKLFGVVLWDQGFEKSKNPERVNICTLQKSKHNNYKLWIVPLMEFWSIDTKIRINNQNDKKNVPHTDEIIRDQIAYAQTNKTKWHNTEHFTYWCRYGPPHINYRSKLNSISDGGNKWSSFTLNGFLQLKNRFRRMTTK